MSEGKTYYTWRQFDGDILKIAEKLHLQKKQFNGIWGPPRGGLVLAVCLSHALGLPLVSRPKDQKTLIVDDIVDTGATLSRLKKKGFFIVSLFYHLQSTFEPDLWFREKKKQWIVFPWEAKS